MQETLNPVSTDAARRELEAVAVSLARTPRLEQLVRYLGRHYLDGSADELTEYNIATDVFGRKKTEFIASEDAIARVETHRLRKKLTAFYEGPGREHAIQIRIPLGSYVPQFAEQWVESNVVPAEELIAPAEHNLPTAPLSSKTWPPTPPKADASLSSDRPVPAAVVEVAKSGGFRWWVPAAAVLLLIATVAGLAALRSRITGNALTSFATRPSTVGTVSSGAPNPSARTASGLLPVSLPFRMIAGYDGAPQRDNAGDTWQHDQYADGGWSRHPYTAFVARTGSPILFRYGRDGDFSYNIPLLPGSYELHLYFMQGADTDQSEDAENKAISTVAINGTTFLKNFDIVSDALGRNVADERVLKDVSPASDGLLHIQLSTVLGTPSLCAIQIFSDATHKQLPLRIVMQPTTYTDPHGQLWRPDDYYLSGRSLSHNLPVSTTDPSTLPFERYGHFQYALPVDTRGRYTLTLKFTELYFGAPGADNGDDRRIFRVMCNGQTLLDDFDINRETGSFHTVEKTFHHLKPSAQGKLNLDFEPITNYATVSSIQVEDESD